MDVIIHILGSKERMSEDETKYLLTTNFLPLLSSCLLLSIYSILHRCYYSRRKLYIQSLLVYYFLLKLSQKEMVDEPFYVV